MKKYVNGEPVELTQDEIAEVEARAFEAEQKKAVMQKHSQILSLEATVTQRRMREAILTEDGKKWIETAEAQIASLREQLRG